MNDDIGTSIRELQTGESESAQRAFGQLMRLSTQDSARIAAALSQAVMAECAAGGLRTPRLLTLLGLTREPSQACVDASLGVLRKIGGAQQRLPTDAVLGAAAIIALSRPRALLPDIAAFQANPGGAEPIGQDLVSAIPQLIAISNEWLRQSGTSAVANMVRWLWRDFAVCDLSAVSDFAGMSVEKLGCKEPIFELFADIVEQLPATADEKRYARDCIEASGGSSVVIARLNAAWRATLVLPERDAAVSEEPMSGTDAEPPAPDPRVDEALVLFSEDNPQLVELGKAMLDDMFGEPRLSAALVFWLLVTVDALPERRRSADIDWVLMRLGELCRREPHRVLHAPGSILQKWLDVPRLLSATATCIALELLSRAQPVLIVRRYLHRAIAVSDERNSRVLKADLWRRVVRADAGVVFLIVARWFAFGFERCELTDLLLELLVIESRTNPHIAAEWEHSLLQSSGSSAAIVAAARTVLKQLGDLQRHGS